MELSDSEMSEDVEDIENALYSMLHYGSPDDVYEPQESIDSSSGKQKRNFRYFNENRGTTDKNLYTKDVTQQHIDNEMYKVSSTTSGSVFRTEYLHRHSKYRNKSQKRTTTSKLASDSSEQKKQCTSLSDVIDVEDSTTNVAEPLPVETSDAQFPVICESSAKESQLSSLAFTTELQLDSESSKFLSAVKIIKEQKSLQQRTQFISVEKLPEEHRHRFYTTNSYTSRSTTKDSFLAYHRESLKSDLQSLVSSSLDNVKSVDNMTDLTGCLHRELMMFYDTAIEVDLEELDDFMNSPGKSTLWQICDEDLKRQKRKSWNRDFFRGQCHNCNQYGHKEMYCPNPVKVPKCHLCGNVEHAAEDECDFLVCFECRQVCGTKSHVCLPLTTCKLCGVYGHRRSNCPDHWRRYHITTEGPDVSMPSYLKHSGIGTVYCFNCSAKGHLGHECSLLTQSKKQRHPTSPFIFSYKQSISSYNNVTVKSKHQTLGKACHIRFTDE